MPATKRPRLPLDLTHLRPGLRLFCAISGGADSTALLLALHEANAAKEPLGLVLSAVHIHHNLRGEAADADQAFVRHLCGHLALPLLIERVDTPARQLAEREGLEEAARHLRYEVFHRLLAEGRADAIATAHTLEDQAETVLLKLLRGAWTDGLSGISPILKPAPPSTGPILRPLLNTRRAAIEQFLIARNQPWQEDATNQDLTLTRNRIRHQLLPILRSFNPQIEEQLATLADTAREEEAFWKAEVAKLLPGLLLPGKPVRGGGRALGTGEQSCALELERLRPLSPPLRRRLLRAAARSLGCRINAEQTGRLVALAGFATHPNVEARNGARQQLGAGLLAERSLREVRLTRQIS